MGSIIHTECKNCRLRKELLFGFGICSFYHDNTEAAKSCRKQFFGEDKKRVLVAIESGKAEVSNFRSVYKCYNCGDYRDGWCILVEGAGSEKKYGSNELICKQCGATMQNLGELSKLELLVELGKCPLCGHDNEVCGGGSWD